MLHGQNTLRISGQKNIRAQFALIHLDDDGLSVGTGNGNGNDVYHGIKGGKMDKKEKTLAGARV